MTLKLFNVWVIYQINTLEHSMLSFFLILESLNQIWASFDIFALQCYNKRQGRKLRRSLLGGSGGMRYYCDIRMPPREILKIKLSETAFRAFWRSVW